MIKLKPAEFHFNDYHAQVNGAKTTIFDGDWDEIQSFPMALSEVEFHMYVYGFQNGYRQGHLVGAEAKVAEVKKVLGAMSKLKPETEVSEFDRIMADLEHPDYPVFCLDCGFETTNEFIEGHECLTGERPGLEYLQARADIREREWRATLSGQEEE